MVKNRGQQPLPIYVTSWGETINGAVLSSDGRLRPAGKSTPAFGPAGDERLAVHRFKTWQAKQGGLEPLPPAMDGGKEFWRDYFRSLILNDPQRAAIELNIDHLAFNPTIPTKPQWTLEELAADYLATRRNEDTGLPLNKKYKENSERAWSDFREKVGVVYARDISGSIIRAYQESTLSEREKGKSPAWVRTRFVAVKTILRHGLDHCPDGEKGDYQTALAYCSILKSPTDKVDPEPISVDDFKTLLKHASTREKAMLLMGLNMAGHGGEVCILKKTEVDLKAKSLVCRRSKNGYPRVAHLWDRTVTAVRDYQAETPRNESDYLFVSGQGTPMTSEALRQRIVSIRERAERLGDKIPADITFEGLRDAALGVAEECDAHHAKFLAGHKTGMSDKYVLRQAGNKKVVACCQAIERHFFGKKRATPTC